jgi:very-short-patch-repair endonuclease
MYTRRRDADALLRRYAREMRRQPTDAERVMWGLLRDRRLGGFKFRRQTPVSGYVVDFYCEAASLVVELDGDQHGEPGAVEYDGRRTERLGELRIRVMRFANGDVLAHREAVAATILRLLREGK